MAGGFNLLVIAVVLIVVVALIVEEMVSSGVGPRNVIDLKGCKNLVEKLLSMQTRRMTV